MSKMPNKVKELNDEADKIIESMEKEKDQEEPKRLSSVKDSESVSAESQDIDNSDDEDVSASTEEDIKSEIDELREQAEYWKNKYDVLQGKYDAEVSALNTLVANLQDRLEAVEQNTVQTTQDTESYDLGSFKDDYPDIYSAVSYMIKSELESFRSKLMEQLTEIKQRTSRSEESNFYVILDNLVPEWKKLNRDPKFIKWLQKVDPFTGATREALLKHAYEEKDAQRVGVFFQQYLKESSPRKNVTALETPPTRNSSYAPKETPKIDEDLIQDFSNKALYALKRGDYKKSEEIEGELDSLLRKLSAT